MIRIRLLSLATMVGLILINRWIFSALFDMDYVLWYISNGAFIGAGITFISLVSKSFKKDVKAISADPGVYLATYLRYLGMTFYIFSTDVRLATGHVGIADDSSAADDSGMARERSSNDIHLESGSSAGSHGCISSLWGLVDGLLMMVWMFILLIASFLWVAVVIPLQYFVFLVCGAPARYFQQSKHRAIVGSVDGVLTVDYLRKSQETPSGWHDASMGIEPFSLTNLLSILFFAAIKYVLSSL